jgi:hypothetical protein
MKLLLRVLRIGSGCGVEMECERLVFADSTRPLEGNPISKEMREHHTVIIHTSAMNQADYTFYQRPRKIKWNSETVPHLIIFSDKLLLHLSGRMARAWCGGGGIRGAEHCSLLAQGANHRFRVIIFPV